MNATFTQQLNKIKETVLPKTLFADNPNATVEVPVAAVNQLLKLADQMEDALVESERIAERWMNNADQLSGDYLYMREALERILIGNTKDADTLRLMAKDGLKLRSNVTGERL